MRNHHNRPEGKHDRPSPIAAVAVVSLLIAVLPASMATTASGVSQQECLTLGDRSVVQDVTVALLEECSALYPDDIELLEHLGVAYETTDSDSAIRIYTRALELDPSFADLRLRLGRLLLRRGDAVGTLQQVEAALRVQPNRRALLSLRDDARAAARERP